jgi:SulP family sulfate permease
MTPRARDSLGPIFRSLRGAGAGAWRFDLFAGLTLAAIAIPEQMATARLGGFSPQIGFFAFIAGSFAFAAFGASRCLSSGADSTITPIFAGTLAHLAAAGTPEYAALSAMLALLVGALLLFAGVFRAGWIADLLSVPVMTGFLAGISIHIALSQAPGLLGLPGEQGDIFERLTALAQDIYETNMASLVIGLSCLGFIVVSAKISERIPSALLALAAATFVTWRFDLESKGVETLGAVPSVLPHPAIPVIAPEAFMHVAGLAVVIAVIIMVQTAATSRSFAAASEAPDINGDFLGVGAGSFLAGVFGAFPVDASPPRTAIVSATGGRSQISGLVASVVIAAVALYGGEALAHVPHAALAGVLLYIAARIFRIRTMLDIGRKTRAEFGLVVVTALAVVFLPIQSGVALAIGFSLVHGMWTTTRTRLILFERVPGTSIWWPMGETTSAGAVFGETLEGVLVVAYQAPLSFLNVRQFQDDFLKAMQEAGEGLKLVVLEASSIVEIDFTAAGLLAGVVDACKKANVEFAIARLESVRAQHALEKFEVLKALGKGRMFRSVDEATRALAPDAPVRRRGE